MSALFVTASGTNVGKTFVTHGLICHLRARGRAVHALKPVLSGYDPVDAATSDAGLLLAALGRPVTPETIAAITPWRFAAPLSPDMAARREGRAVDFDALVGFCRQAMAAHDPLLIEGVGGVMVPLDDRHTVRDWIVALDIPVLLVVGSYLGVISHALTALDVLRTSGRMIAAVVVSESEDSTVPLDETVATIQRFAAGAPVLALPREPTAHPNFTELANVCAL